MNLPHTLPPRNTSVMYRRKGEDEFTTGKTAKGQPKPSSRNRGYVNFQGDESKPQGYSIKWEEVEEWCVLEEDKKKDSEHEKLESSEESSEDDTLSEKTEPQKIHQNSALHENDERSESGKKDEEGISNDSNEVTEDSTELSAKSVQYVTEEDRKYMEEYEDYNKELPPYQPPKSQSDSYFSLNESIIVDKMHQMSIHEDTDVGRKVPKKRTPMKVKIQKLRTELTNEKEKVRDLELLIAKISNEDDSKIRQELANMIKTKDIYKEEIRKLIRNQNSNDVESEALEAELHAKTTSLVHLRKSEILNENSSLHRNIEKLKNEMNVLQKTHNEVKDQIEKDKELRKEYEMQQLKILELELKCSSDSTIDMQLSKKNEEIKNLVRKLEESKFQLSECIKESSNLKVINTQIMDENNQIRAIQIKNENIIYLQKENLNFYRQLSYKSSNQYTPHSSDKSDIDSSDESIIEEPSGKRNERTEDPNKTKKYSSAKKRQGLPNEKKNACYIISTMHALAKSLPSQQQQNDCLMKLLRETRNCLEGHKSEQEAQSIMQDIWEYTTTMWPEHYKDKERIRQQDAAEYLRRVIEQGQINEETELYINISSKCYNNQCQVISKEERITTNILEYIGDKEELTLQEIIDAYITEIEQKCAKCKHPTSSKNVIKKAPKTLIVEIARGKEDQSKSNTKIKNPEEIIQLEENGRKINYKTCSIIKHKGEEIESGHCIVNSYNENMDDWEVIDDHEISMLRNKEENEMGVIYVLKQCQEPVPFKPSERREKSSYSEIVSNNKPKQNYERQSESREEMAEYRHRNNNRRPSITTDSNFDKERKSIEMKKNNIIIRGIPERSKERDIEAIIDINKKIGNKNFDRRNIMKIERIGENFENGRPLKVEFDSSLTKLRIMRNLYLLQYDERYDRISIQHDLTRNQMKEYKELIEKSVEEEQRDRSGRFKYRVRGPPGKWEIVKIQKNY